MIIMLRHTYLALVAFALLLGLSSCGGSGSGSSTDDASTPPPSTAARQVDLDPDDERCPYGGVLVQTGIDENRNGKLDDDEVDASEAVCNGAPGTNGDDGLPSLLKRTVLAIGDANCPAGGEFIQSGVDANGNSILDDDEVDASAYLCTSPASLLKRTVLLAGDANCPAGGEFVESGIDANGNGTLEASEVDDSAYLCHSLALLYAEVEQTMALRSKACPLGGLEGQFGIDANGNGTLEAAEVNAAIPVDCYDTKVGQVLADEVTTDRWSTRSGHSSVVFDGKLWMLGGAANGNNHVDDVWSSEDGVIWEEVTASAGWSSRSAHSSVVFDGKLWVIGGTDNTSYFDDVWSSTDGATWTQETAAAGWSGRFGHSSVVYGSKLWVIGGNDGSYQDDVWSSSDGATWTQVTISGGSWSGRLGHSVVVFDDKLWVIGGYRYDSSHIYLNDVWSSTDGASWTQATASAAWSGRRYHSSVVYDDKLWVLGGYRFDGSNNVYLADVWSSSDGASWTEETPSDAWSGRSGHSSVVFGGYLWVLGGTEGGNLLNDVWVFAP